MILKVARMGHPVLRQSPSRYRRTKSHRLRFNV